MNENTSKHESCYASCSTNASVALCSPLDGANFTDIIAHGSAASSAVTRSDRDFNRYKASNSSVCNKNNSSKFFSITFKLNSRLRDVSLYSQLIQENVYALSKVACLSSVIFGKIFIKDLKKCSEETTIPNRLRLDENTCYTIFKYTNLEAPEPLWNSRVKWAINLPSIKKYLFVHPKNIDFLVREEARKMFRNIKRMYSLSELLKRVRKWVYVTAGVAPSTEYLYRVIISSSGYISEQPLLNNGREYIERFDNEINKERIPFQNRDGCSEETMWNNAIMSYRILRFLENCRDHRLWCNRLKHHHDDMQRNTRKTKKPRLNNKGVHRKEEVPYGKLYSLFPSCKLTIRNIEYNFAALCELTVAAANRFNPRKNMNETRGCSNNTLVMDNNCNSWNSSESLGPDLKTIHNRVTEKPAMSPALSVTQRKRCYNFSKPYADDQTILLVKKSSKPQDAFPLSNVCKTTANVYENDFEVNMYCELDGCVGVCFHKVFEGLRNKNNNEAIRPNIISDSQSNHTTYNETDLWNGVFKLPVKRRNTSFANKVWTDGYKVTFLMQRRFLRHWQTRKFTKENFQSKIESFKSTKEDNRNKRNRSVTTRNRNLILNEGKNLCEAWNSSTVRVGVDPGKRYIATVARYYPRLQYSKGALSSSKSTSLLEERRIRENIVNFLGEKPEIEKIKSSKVMHEIGGAHYSYSLMREQKQTLIKGNGLYDIIANQPSRKTSALLRVKAYQEYYLDIMEEQLKFSAQRKILRQGFNIFQSKQFLYNRIAKKILNWNPRSVHCYYVCYGDTGLGENFSAGKGSICKQAQRVIRQLETLPRVHVEVVDEYRTSKMCSNCFRQAVVDQKNHRLECYAESCLPRMKMKKRKNFYPIIMNAGCKELALSHGNVNINVERYNVPIKLATLTKFSLSSNSLTSSAKYIASDKLPLCGRLLHQVNSVMHKQKSVSNNSFTSSLQDFIEPERRETVQENTKCLQNNAISSGEYSQKQQQESRQEKSELSNCNGNTLVKSRKRPAARMCFIEPIIKRIKNAGNQSRSSNDSNPKGKRNTTCVTNNENEKQYSAEETFNTRMKPLRRNRDVNAAINIAVVGMSDALGLSKPIYLSRSIAARKLR